MLFNSYIFWAFFATVILIYWRLGHRGQNFLLLVASYVFYGYWDWRFLSLIAFSTIVDFIVAQNLVKETRQPIRQRWLLLSLCSNLGLLGFFKYFGFFSKEFAVLLESLGFYVSMPTLNIILPVGISFYTFQTLAYTIDVYRGKTKPTSNLLDFSVYVSFFPQLVAGPIERSKDLLPQIVNRRTFTKGDFSEGLYHILIGMFKKVVIADNMAPIVNQVFATPVSDLNGTEILIGVYAFAFQIYGDFSGYSSIAQGIAKWLGINLSWNFRMPYFARTPSEFWRRWHITLSSWLRDYLYIPLGGNRHGVFNTFKNLVLTMFLGGLWHGANWTFAVWGLAHGFILVVYHALEDATKKLHIPGIAGKVIAAIIFFHLVCITWLLFRAENLSQAVSMFGQLFHSFSMTEFSLYSLGMLVFFVLPIIILELIIERSGDMLYVLKTHWLVQAVIYSYFIFMLIIFPPLTPQVFIYFQF
ncbi:MBOAT family O-acyltransferase [Candidatus Thiodiazotropha sp. CDECU1]|uniref:MBOAT family O-acyltransferase n=1 Tax=Candidatus Thiodiazotropha sp. CDECU1 TaxID=3065865 RepID=UPI0029319568|nr:MBOAT family O-acyltransferase [Candidatus Thiodiazotropha sp. CDECU1]